MPYALTASGAIGLLSAVAIAALGLVVLQMRPRGPSTLAFSAFALLWGAGAFSGNLQDMSTDAPTLLRTVLVTAALYSVLYVPLVLLVVAMARPGRAFELPFFLVLTLPGVVALLAIVSRPDLFAQLQPGDGGPQLAVTPALGLIGIVGSVLSFALAFALTLRLAARAQTERERGTAGLLMGAFGAYVGYRSAFYVGQLARSDIGDVVDETTFAFRLATGVLGLALCAFALVRAHRGALVPWRGALAGLMVIAAFAGALEGVYPALEVHTAGVWRLVMVALFAYAIARYRMFDVELKLSNLAPVGAYALVAFSAVGLLWALAGSSLRASPLLGAAATLGLAMVCAPAARLGHYAIARAAPHVRDPEYLYKRKVDVYRAALEEADTRGMGHQTEQLFLSDLRRRLGISEPEHRILMLIVRSQAKYGPAGPAGTQVAPPEFHVERELGRGSAGRALLARDAALDRPVVLKQPIAPWLLDAEGRRHFVQEARLAASVHHPNVVAIHQVLPDADPPAIVMEYVEGGSLQDALSARGKLEPKEAHAVALDVLSGLEAIHAKGIVHRDLKPANILLDRKGVAKITDFGIARPPPRAALAATIATSGGGQPGSVAYMSPEQARGDDVDARTDLYAAAAVLHIATFGRHYVDLAGCNEQQARRRLQDAPPAIDPAASPAMRAVLDRALAKDPTARYQTAAEMRAALAEAS